MADVALTAAIDYALTGEVDLAAAVTDAAIGMVDPLKTVKKAKKLSKLLKKKGKCCFVAGTKVLTNNGLVNIETLELGDLVLAKDETTGQQDWKPVTHLFIKNRPVYELTVSSAQAEVEVIGTTDDHPFWVVGKGWVTTIELSIGDQIETADGGIVVVEQIVFTERIEETYNIEVADYHTYYVTELGIWVHNSDKCDPNKTSLTKSDHAKLRSSQGRSTSQAHSDLQNARDSDIFIQDDGRFVIRGPNGREHIAEQLGQPSLSGFRLKQQLGHIWTPTRCQTIPPHNSAFFRTVKVVKSTTTTPITFWFLMDVLVFDPLDRWCRGWELDTPRYQK